MTPLTGNPFARALKGAAIALVLYSPAAAAQAEGAFSNLNGSWSGAGVITLASGVKERIRCRATYNVDQAGTSLNLALRCASDGYKFDLEGSVSHVNGAVTGHWSEKTNATGGTIHGRGEPGRIQVRTEGPFSALLGLTTRDNRQSISISSPGSQMSEVAITMIRGK